MMHSLLLPFDAELLKEGFIKEDFENFLANPDEYIESWKKSYQPIKRGLLSRIKTLFN